MLSALKSLQLWQIIVLVVVTLGTAGGVYAIYSWATGPSTSSLPANTQLVPVQYGNLVNSVSASGSLVFSTRERLTFGSAGIVQEVNVKEGDTVEEGQVLAKLDSASLISLQKAVAQARINLRDAEENLEKAQNPYTTDDIAHAETQVETAQINLDNARQDLADTQKEWETKIQEAEDGLSEAEEGYKKVFLYYFGMELTEEQLGQEIDTILAQANIDPIFLFDMRRHYSMAEAEEVLEALASESGGTWDPLKVIFWQYLFPAPPSVEDIVDEAEVAWEVLTEAKDQPDIAPLRAAKAIATSEGKVAQAEDSLTVAEENLATMKAGPDPLVVELKQLEVASAQAALDQARERLEMATMVSPLSGIVTSVNVEAGQMVNANAVAIEIVDTSVVEMSAIVDEIDVSQVKQGQRVTVSLDALLDIELSGEVSTISVTAWAQAGVVSYPVTIGVTLPSGIQLREGMSATASIVVQEVNNVLLIPNQAIGGSFDSPVVKVMVNGEIQEMPVSLGVSDDLWTEVVVGLREGDVVVVEVAAAGTTQQGFPGGFQGFPGSGFGGGGGRQFPGGR